MKTATNKSGGALVMVMVILLAVSAMGVGMFKLQELDGIEAVRKEQSNKAFWLAETGLQQTLHQLRTSAIYRGSLSPLSSSVGDGGYASITTVSGGTNFTVTSTGTVQGVTRVVQLRADLRVSIDQDNFEFALIGLNGNKSTLNKDGTIDGSVYSAGELWVNGRATPNVSGDIFAEDGRNVDFQELTEMDQLDLSIDTAAFDFSVAGSAATYTNMIVEGISKTYLDLTGGKVVKHSGDLTLADGTIGDGTLIVDGNLKFTTTGAPYSVDDGALIMVDGGIYGQKDGTFGEGVTVYATGNMTLKKAATGFNTEFLVLGDLTADKDLDFLGLIYVEGTVQVDGDLTLEGAMITGDYWLKGGYDLTYNSAYLDGNIIINSIISVRSGSWRELPAG